jgi:hypothetical protein
MRVHATPGAVVIRFGKRFSAPEAERVSETVLALAPVSSITLDFTDTRELQDATILPLASLVVKLQVDRVQLLGLTRHQVRLFRYLGLDPADAPPDGQRADRPTRTCQRVARA